MDKSGLANLEAQSTIVVTASQQVKPKRKQLQDLAAWMEAFLTFVAIRSKKAPEETRDLIAYGAHCQGASDYKGSGWLFYDFQFRRVAAARGTVTQWAMKDISLLNETVAAKHDWPSTSYPSQADERKMSQKLRMDPNGSTIAQAKRSRKAPKTGRAQGVSPSVTQENVVGKTVGTSILARLWGGTLPNHMPLHLITLSPRINLFLTSTKSLGI